MIPIVEIVIAHNADTGQQSEAIVLPTEEAQHRFRVTGPNRNCVRVRISAQVDNILNNILPKEDLQFIDSARAGIVGESQRVAFSRKRVNGLGQVILRRASRGDADISGAAIVRVVDAIVGHKLPVEVVHFLVVGPSVETSPIRGEVAIVDQILLIASMCYRRYQACAIGAIRPDTAMQAIASATRNQAVILFLLRAAKRQSSSKVICGEIARFPRNLPKVCRKFFRGRLLARTSRAGVER